MINTVTINAYTVYTNYITLVFDGACLQQGFPGKVPALRPVGHINGNIVFKIFFRIKLLAAPHGEAQIITHKQSHAPTIYRRNETLLAGRVVLIFVSISKQVAFVVT